MLVKADESKVKAASAWLGKLIKDEYRVGWVLMGTAILFFNCLMLMMGLQFQLDAVLTLFSMLMLVVGFSGFRFEDLEKLKMANKGVEPQFQQFREEIEAVVGDRLVAIYHSELHLAIIAYQQQALAKDELLKIKENIEQRCARLKLGKDEIKEIFKEYHQSNIQNTKSFVSHKVEDISAGPKKSQLRENELEVAGEIKGPTHHKTKNKKFESELKNFSAKPEHKAEQAIEQQYETFKGKVFQKIDDQEEISMAKKEDVLFSDKKDNEAAEFYTSEEDFKV